jgi:hypothetical protein
MSDAGEGLVDADTKLQERIEERAQERARKAVVPLANPENVRELESLRLARVELERQSAVTRHPARLAQIAAAIAELDRRIDVT